MSGKLTAKEFRGVLLTVAAVLASKKGSELLKSKKTFGKEAGLKDWTLLVELLLEWEAYLNLHETGPSAKSVSGLKNAGNWSLRSFLNHCVGWTKRLARPWKVELANGKGTLTELHFLEPVDTT